ncbi:MAG TPA: pH regulation protein F, partial [Gammaproteobacteria bacterium]|nr:pH regulation protein F [Gammaproteobacteria bacterium]
MYYVATIATLITMALALVRALQGPSVYDRVLAA